MNQITQFDQTMTSREIASVTGKRHDHVLRDIRDMLQDIGIEPSEGVSPNLGRPPCVTHCERIDPQNGQAYPEYRLDRDLTLILVSGYSAKRRCLMKSLLTTAK